MGRLQGLGLAAFCLFAGSRWLVENAFPSSMPVLQQQCMHFIVLAVAGWSAWLVGSRAAVRRSHSAGWPKLMLAGVLLLSVPVLLQEFARSVTEENGAALFALIPLFIVVGVAAFGAGLPHRELMLPALIGLAGSLLLLPFQLPTTGYGVWLFAVGIAAALLTACINVWMYTLLQSRPVALSLAILCAGNAVVLGLVVLARGSVALVPREWLPEILRCLLFDLPQLTLLMWLLRELPPERLSARYLLVPLVTVIEGIVLLHPALDLRLAAGILCMLVGSGALLFWSNDAAEGSSSSLGLG